LSLVTDSRPVNYQAIRPYRSSLSEGPIVICIHGNKWGVAECCEDLDQTSSEHEPMLGYQSLDERGQTGAEDSNHCHESKQDVIDEKARKKLLVASGLCLFFMSAEIVGGVLSNSLAIATDAAHLLTDFASFLISLFALWMTTKPKSRKMTYGWHRAEVLGAIASVLMIWLVTGLLVYLAILRVITPDFEIDATVMLITSSIGVLVNIVMGATLHQHGHSHGGGGGGHGHAHDLKGKNGIIHAEEGHAQNKAAKENINVQAAFIHVVGDFLQSVGVFIAAMVIFFKPEWQIIDPICTFLFSIVVLATTLNILRKTLDVLLQATPADIDYDSVKDTFLSIKGIRQIHNMKVWSLTTDKAALSAHLAVEQGLNPHEVLREATKKIRSRYDFFDMTLQVEEFVEEMSACDDCKDLE